MPSVAAIDEMMRAWSREWSGTDAFRPAGGEGIFNTLWRLVEAYYARSPRPHLGLRLNFEKVLGEMLALASWTTPSPFGNALRSAIADGTPSDDFVWPEPGSEQPYAARVWVLEQLRFLLDRLANHFRDLSRGFRSNTPEFFAYARILSALREHFDVGVYNLNYDNLAVSAWPDAFTGFRPDGEFDARGVHRRQEWGFVYHLHGSVHHSFPDAVFAMRWEADLTTGTFSDRGFPYESLASDFKPILLTTLIAGGYKLDQLLADPFQTLHASLIRHAHEADAVLIGGYGFGDVHVNRALSARFALSRRMSVARPRAAVLAKTEPQLRQTGLRQDVWAYELTHALDTRFQTFKTPEAAARAVVVGDDFETDLSGGVAVWHGGYLEAATEIEAVTRHLRG
jgi:hypothetical protein